MKVPDTGGEVAAEAGPVSEPRLMVSVKPGGRPEPVPAVHCTAVVELAPSVVKSEPHVAVPEKVHPVGAMTVNEVRA